MSDFDLMKCVPNKSLTKEQIEQTIKRKDIWLELSRTQCQRGVISILINRTYPFSQGPIRILFISGESDNIRGKEYDCEYVTALKIMVEFVEENLGENRASDK